MFSYVPLANKLWAATGPLEIVDQAQNSPPIGAKAVTSSNESARIERRLSTEPVSWSQPLRFMRNFEADSGDGKSTSRPA